MTFNIGEIAFSNVKEKFSYAWDEISDEDKDAIKEVMMDVVAIAVRQTMGEDVDSEIAHIDAQIKNWGFVGVSRAKTAMKEALVDTLGEIAAYVAKALIP